MNLALSIIIPVLALAAGFVAGVSMRDAARVDTANRSYRVLRQVHQENAGLSRDTRIAVIEAIRNHESMGSAAQRRKAS